MARDITHLKIKDIYTGRLVQARTPEELGEWILSETATKSEALTRTINSLVNSLNSGSEYRWDAAANGLEITEKKTRRRKR